jgi:hypothetical protein
MAGDPHDEGHPTTDRSFKNEKNSFRGRRLDHPTATPDRDGLNSGDQLRRKAAFTFAFLKKIWLRSKKVFRFH